MAGGLWWRLDYYLLQPNRPSFPRLVLILIFALLPHSRARTTFSETFFVEIFRYQGTHPAGILGRQYCGVSSGTAPSFQALASPALKGQYS